MATQTDFPLNWRIGQDFDPNEHLMQLKGRDYLNVQNRLLWFIRDQRALIVAGLAKMPYIVQTDIVEMDRQSKWAHFKTYVRDVLGNEVTMYGSESANDFADYAEKASTKSLGRALLALGYGTAFAPEMDEGERVVDSPVERTTPQQSQTRPPVTRPTPPRPAPMPQKPVTKPADEIPMSFTVDDPPAPPEPIQINVVEEIRNVKDALDLPPGEWDAIKRDYKGKPNEMLLAYLQELYDAKRDGYPLKRPAQKAQ